MPNRSWSHSYLLSWQSCSVPKRQKKSNLIPSVQNRSPGYFGVMKILLLRIPRTGGSNCHKWDYAYLGNAMLPYCSPPHRENYKGTFGERHYSYPSSFGNHYHPLKHSYWCQWYKFVDALWLLKILSWNSEDCSIQADAWGHIWIMGGMKFSLVNDLNSLPLVATEQSILIKRIFKGSIINWEVGSLFFWMPSTNFSPALSTLLSTYPHHSFLRLGASQWTTPPPF